MASPSASKAQSKLWFEDGFWWGVLFDAVSHDYHIFRLDRAGGTWLDTGVPVDDRSSSRADVLSVPGGVYVLSGTEDTELRLYQYTYNPDSVTYFPEIGSPVVVGDRATYPVLGRSTDGALWATWTTVDGVVEVAHTAGSAARWSTPTALPVAAGRSELASVTAVGNDRIGIMWASEAAEGYLFSTHRNGAPPEEWTEPEPALVGPGLLDDHIDLATTPDGRVLAVVKTEGQGDEELGLIVLLVRSTLGQWTAHTVGRRGESHTRANVLVDADRGLVHVVLTGPQPPSTNGQKGGNIYVKTAPLDDPSFGPGLGRLLMEAPLTPRLNNASSTKQPVNGTTGLVVLASNAATEDYWFADDREFRAAPIRADFAAVGASALFLPHEVRFLQRSVGPVTGWTWDFGDGSPTSTEANPTHTYHSHGRFTVTLTVTDGATSHTYAARDLVTIGDAPAAPRAREVPAEARTRSGRDGGLNRGFVAVVVAVLVFAAATALWSARRGRRGPTDPLSVEVQSAGAGDRERAFTPRRTPSERLRSVSENRERRSV